ncbi:DUF433 domain-containing protein [Cronbergia sp. UHCC 0137]|uniref:DUF433 domain-containing protein n=1 Tax=Cronbergia sp. UHCC 0137 TaxID=3110239 RepID=UPI002B203DAA|nr:DUF433 domain-containing protein [Cronbergia sp. UHCC 0137]MEA5620958.1 DUF433 domain-containing protein [Cronbergia sp. UHCC 0137]
MIDKKLLNRITTNPKIMVGKPTIKGTRLTVEYILNLLAQGVAISEILEEYQGLEEADIRACLLFASRSLESTSFMPLTAEIA